MLYVQPASDFSDPIVAYLRHQGLVAQPAPLYETISYVWGDATNWDVITLNGVLLDLPLNSIQALRRFRLGHLPRVLWMDAVCINQQDLVERAQQVSEMADIYHGSQGTLVHLGEASDGDDSNVEASDSKTDAIRYALEEVGRMNDDMKTWTKNHTSFEGTRFDTPTPYATSATVRGLTTSVDFVALENHLFSRPWFR